MNKNKQSGNRITSNVAATAAVAAATTVAAVAAPNTVHALACQSRI